ncbi:MAG TPA: hypothetical protein VFY48_08840 [Solirubrobacterales bacterium]|nr:hypothetical protein [Solirubrobacterales bacterium]
MRVRLLGTLVALAVPATLAAPAEARPGYEVQERSLRLAVHPGASAGYEATIETEGHRRVTLTVRRGGTTAAYRTTGRVTKRGIEARFGDLGHVSVRFDGEPRPFPSLLPRRLRKDLADAGLIGECFGPKPVREIGTFSGSIRFRDERGLERIDARRARGDVRRFYTRVCERSPFDLGLEQGDLPSALADFELSIFYAADASGDRRVSFEAIGLDLGLPGESPGGFFLANGKLLERREGMAVTRTALSLLDEGSVIASRPGKSPVTATVTVPPPFSGTADYRKERGAPASWSGSLAFRSLGAGVVPLTGPGFSAALCRVRLAELLSSPCLRRAGAPIPRPAKPAPPVGSQPTALELALARAQGSGSQSQVFWDARLPWSR